MYRIRIFSNFSDSNNCKSVYESLCEVDKMDNYGPTKSIYIVNDNEPYTHAILMNTAMPLLQIPPINVVGFAFEPPQLLFAIHSNEFNTYLNYVNENVNKYYIGSNKGLISQFIESYSYMWHTTPPKIIPYKNNLFSIMISQKMYAPGHKYRHELVKKILHTNYPIDIYGRGCKYYNNDARIKGEFIETEPYEEYMFHICIENYKTNSYTSEKYTNTLLWGATPIYWGAINPIFPSFTIELTGNISNDMDIIKDIVINPMKFKKYFSQEEIRDKINLLKNLDTIFS